MRGTRYTKTPSGREFFHSLLAKKEEPEPTPEQPTLIQEQEDDF
jgi:hypothetical protein